MNELIMRLTELEQWSDLGSSREESRSAFWTDKTSDKTARDRANSKEYMSASQQHYTGPVVRKGISSMSATTSLK